MESGSKLFRRSDGAAIATTGFANIVDRAVTPAFSPDGRKVVLNFWTGAGGNGVSSGAGRSIAVVEFDCGAASGSTACTSTPPYAFGGAREIYRDGARYPAWPAFLPDAIAVVFHNGLKRGDCGDDPPKPNTSDNCQLST